MKYIDAEKLTKAIEDKGLDCSFALKMERLDILALIDSLQQEQPYWEPSESEDERIAEELIKALRGISTGLHQYAIFLTEEEKQRWLSWLEKQKENANSFTDGIIEVRSFQRGMEEGRKLETQKEPGIKWLKSDNVKNPDKPYVDKAGMFYTTDGRMCYASEIEQQKEQKPRWEINNPHTTKWTKEMIDEKFEELVEEYHKQKPVVTHGETYHVDTLGTQQVIAGKMPQKSAEWSEEDEIYLHDALWCVEKAEKSCKDEEDKGACWSAKRWLKSLRPQPREEIYQSAKHNIAIRFMNYLDENRPEGKMSLSNGECEDIDKAFKENDWAKILRYAEKYGK